MNIAKHLPTLARWFSLSPDLPEVNLNDRGDLAMWRIETRTETPVAAKEAPRKRVAYIPTEESPWAVICRKNGKWVFLQAKITRASARDLARIMRSGGATARVVRLIVPTR